MINGFKFILTLFSFNVAAHGSCNYTFGLMGPISASDNYFRIVMGGAVAFDMINDHDNEITQMLFPDIDFTVCYPIFDDGGNPSWGIDHVFKMVFSKMYDPANPNVVQQDVLGIVGPGYSSVSKPVSLLASVNDIPLMSYSATSAQLSDKSQYPNFARVIPSDDESTRVLGAFVESFGWEKVIIFACDDDFCTGYADSLLKQRFEYGYEVVASTRFPVQDHQNGGEAIKKALRGIKDLNCRIILMPILTMHVKYIHQYMEELGMFTDDDDSFVWITPDAAVTGSLDNVQTKRGGHLVVRARTPSNHIFEKGLKDGWDGSIDAWKNVMLNNAWLTETVAKTDAEMTALLDGEFEWSFTPYAFDCALMFVKAVYDLRREHGDDVEITSKMILDHWPSISDFEGATGAIQFTENLDRLVDFELVNLRSDLSGDDSYVYHPVRYWSAADPNDVDENGNLRFPHGSVTSASEDYDVHWSATMTNGMVPNDQFTASDDHGMSKAALSLMSVGSVFTLLAVAFFAWYIRRHYMAQDGADRFDAHKKQKQRVLFSMVKALGFFALEILDFVTDVLSASSVFSLMGKDVVSPTFVVLYLSIICIAGVANFGSVCFFVTMIFTI